MPLSEGSVAQLHCHAFEPDVREDRDPAPVYGGCCRRAVTARQVQHAVTTHARDMTLALLASRSPNATVCPSEVARAIAPGSDWRDAMPTVHSAIDRLADEGAVRLSWKGHALAKRDGPYRIGRGSRSPV